MAALLVRALLRFGVLGVVTACARPPAVEPGMPWTPDRAGDLGAVVASVGEVPIFAAEIAAHARITGKPPRDALSELVAMHLLGERWRARWSTADTGPAQAAAKEILVQRLIEREFEATTRRQDVPEPELRALYERAREGFVHPRLVEIAVLTIRYTRRTTPADRAAARQTMAELRKQLDQRKERTPEDLEALANEAGWYQRGVQYMRFYQGPDKPYTSALGTPVAKLRTVGETIGPIEEDSGMFIARYAGERPAQNRSFEQVRQELLDAFYARWRQTRFTEFTRRVADAHKVEVFPDRLAAP